MQKRLMETNPNAFRDMVTTFLEANGRGSWETSEEPRHASSVFSGVDDKMDNAPLVSVIRRTSGGVSASVEVARSLCKATIVTTTKHDTLHDALALAAPRPGAPGAGRGARSGRRHGRHQDRNDE